MGFTKDEMAQELPAMAERDNDPMYGHYVCPLSSTKHYILIDDCSSPEKQTLADKYHAALVLTSSPGNQQRIVMVEAHGDQEVARQAANKLSGYLNTECGDPAVKNGAQDWRIPYFRNHKPKRIMEDGTSPRAELISAQGGTCPQAQALYNDFVLQIQNQTQLKNQLQTRTEQIQNRTKTEHRTNNQQPQPLRSNEATGEWAKCGILWKDVYICAIKQIAHGYARKGMEMPTGHKLDYVVAVRLVVLGYNRNQIATAIQAGAPIAEREGIRTAKGETPDLGRDWNAYAQAKAAEAFTPQAQQLAAKYMEKAKTWAREEQRDAATIQRAYERAGIEIPAEHKKLTQKQEQEQKGMEM